MFYAERKIDEISDENSFFGHLRRNAFTKTLLPKKLILSLR